MKCADILLSTFIHASLVAGVMYGLPQDSLIEEDETVIEPIFFEILEECVIGSQAAKEVSEGSVPTEKGSVPEIFPSTSEGPVPTVPVMTLEGSVPISIAEPPSIENSFDIVEEGPVPLPPATEMPIMQSAEGSVPRAQREQAKIVSNPMALNRIVPVYPRSARRRGREGVVTLEISVSDSGDVSETVVVAGSGHEDLDSAAVSAVRSARFAPATEDGVRVRGKLRLTFEFKLK